MTRAFGDALAALLGDMRGKTSDRPQLILLGDVMDLQYSTRDDAFASARGFLSTLRDTGELCDRLMATAGNHDHALWSDARLNLEAEAFTMGKSGEKLRAATPAFEARPLAQSRLLSALSAAAGFEKGVDLRYPNIGFHNADRAVLLHHGHFVEDEYRLASALKDALAPGRNFVPVDALAAENAGWIDFFWSTTGDAAGMGRSAEEVYQNLLTTRGFRRLTAGWAEHLASYLSENVPMGGRVDVQQMLRVLVRIGFDVTVGKFRDTERYWETAALSPGGYDGLRWYLDGPAYHQVGSELGCVPRDMSFVFGHTHKPFAERIGGTAFPAPVKTYNTGGWPLNGPRLGTAEGAAMVLIDEDLHLAAIRLFMTPENGDAPAAFVEALTDGAGAAAFVRDLRRAMARKPVARAFEALRRASGEAYRLRQKLLLDLTNGADAQPPHLRAMQ